MLLFLQNILQLILKPSHGWEDVAKTTGGPRMLIRKGVYPLFALAALSVFVQLFYRVYLTFPVMVIKAAVVFVSFFVTFYFALVMFKTFIYKFCDQEPSEHKYSVVICYCMCLLAISSIICNVMPVNLGLNYLLPLTVTLIMWKSDVYLQVRPDRNFSFIFFCIVTTILPPIIIQTMFDAILKL